MDLFNDLKLTIQQDLTALGIPFQPNATVEEVLILRYTQMRKIIRPAPRATHQSPEFQTALANCTGPQQAAMADILGKFQNGIDVNAHLSEASDDPSRVDGMLYEWGIYHLHVSNTKRDPNQKFFDRVGPVALVKINAAGAYFIDIQPHGRANPYLWTQQALLAIIDRTWPTLLDPYTLRGVTGVTYSPTDRDLQRLRGELQKTDAIRSRYRSGKVLG